MNIKQFFFDKRRSKQDYKTDQTFQGQPENIQTSASVQLKALHLCHFDKCVMQNSSVSSSFLTLFKVKYVDMFGI